MVDLPRSRSTSSLHWWLSFSSRQSILMGTVGPFSDHSLQILKTIITSSLLAPCIYSGLQMLNRCCFACRAYDIKCIIDLHAAPGSQNGMEHSASRDGSVDWPQPEYIAQTLDVIDFLSSRYFSFLLRPYSILSKAYLKCLIV